MTTWPTLYKMDSTGKIREWTISTRDTFVSGTSIQGVCEYSQTHGVRGGKLQTVRTLIDKGKNIGKANETTPMEQCDLEAQSHWMKQRDRKGYTEAIPTSKPKLPMLAKSYSKQGHRIVWPAMTQPKLDGIRCMAEIKDGLVTLKSRTNNEFLALGHISLALQQTVNQLSDKNITLDGELYNHDYKSDFQSLVSAIKRDDPSVDSHLVQYHVYDVFTKEDFGNRYSFLQTHLVENKSVKLVPTYSVNNFEEFKLRYGKFLTDGYEGGMLRNELGPYDQNRRSPNLQKYKEFMDDEFKIVGAYENKGKQAGQCTFSCITKDGQEFGVKPKGSDEKRRRYWKDYQTGILTGKMMTVKFFEWTTSDKPVPRFPVGIIIRDYE